MRSAAAAAFGVALAAIGASSAGAQSADEPAMPDLASPAAKPQPGDGEKYYYFNRAATSFDEALSDIRQCDGLARGLNPDTGQPSMPGLALAGIVLAIDTGNRRNLRRVNMRRCMFFKGYSRYAVSKTVWETFNFEEGGGSPAEEKRNAMLTVQAKIASGARPAAAELGE